MRDISYLRKKNAMYYITSLLKNKSEIELMGDIAENTTPNFLHDDFNLLVLLSLVVAILSLVYAIATYTAQKKTEGNTKKLSRDAQRSLLNDLIRHMYRNLIIGYAIHTKLDETLWKTYPSEEHLIKLKIPLENIHLDVFYGDDNAFRAMHELYLNMRNYNEEIDVVLAHFSSAAIDEKTLKRDMGTLEFKAFYIVERIISTETEIWGPTNETRELMKTALEKAVLKGSTSQNDIPIEGYSSHFKPITANAIKGTSYALLFGEDKVDELVTQINKAIEIERGLNNRRQEKIHMIQK